MTHILKSNDTIYSLSKKYKIPMAAILRNNPDTDIYNLIPGETIEIPINYDYQEKELKQYIVNEGDSLMDILDTFNIDLHELLRYNNLHDVKLQAGSSLNINSNIE